MTHEEWSALQPGDRVRHKESAEAQIVVATYGASVVVLRAHVALNPDEWDRLA